MGLLDQLLGSVLDQTSPAPDQPGPATQPQQLGGLAQALLAMLSDPRNGGIEGLAQRFQTGGLGDVVQSWIGRGPNRPISPDQLTQVFGRQPLDQLSTQAGIPGAQGTSLIAALLPLLVDKLTPEGEAPRQDQLAQAGTNLLRSLLA